MGYVGKLFTNSSRLSFHNPNIFLLYFTSLRFFFSPNTREKAHLLSEKNIIQTIQLFFRPFLSRLQWILKLGLWSVFIHSQNPQSLVCVCVGEKENGKKAFREGKLWEHTHTKQKFSQWMNEMRNNPGFVVFAADNDSLHFYIFLVCLRSLSHTHGEPVELNERRKKSNSWAVDSLKCAWYFSLINTIWDNMKCMNGRMVKKEGIGKDVM